MSEVIKGNSPINNIIIEGTVEISNKIHGLDDVKPKKDLPQKEEAEESEESEDTAEPQEEEEEERYTVNYEELEALRDQYRKEGEEQVKYLVQRSEQELANARSEADEILKKARTEAASVLAQADKDAELAKEQANKEGYTQGFDEGMKKGMEDGYTAGVKKCKETMEDLKRLYEEYGREKDSLMAENRRAVFDLSLEIAEKITMTAFTQKSKNVLEKMISSAAKEFRKAKNVRITLSKLDITDEMVADSEILQKCFPQSDNVEYEILENAERGTLLIEGDSEILDAGVSTQLKMIEELGRGKFREKEPAQVTEAITDTAETMAAEQDRPKKKKSAPAPQPVSDAVAEPEPEVVAEPVPEAVIEPVSEAVAEPEPEPAAEPVPEAVAELVPEAVAEPEPEPAAEPISEAAAEPVQEKPKKSTSKKAAKPSPEPIQEEVSAPVQEDIFEPVQEDVSEPVPEVIPESALQPILEQEEETPAAEISENAVKVEDELSPDMSADDLMADIDSLIAQAGIDMSDFDAEEEQAAPSEKITLTKNPEPTENN